MKRLSRLDHNFDYGVADYLSHNPPPPEYDCLKRFFSDLRQGNATSRYKKIGRFLLVAACNHIIKISIRAYSRATIRDIKPIGGRWIVG
jgi:hypothetical protein